METSSRPSPTELPAAPAPAPAPKSKKEALTPRPPVLFPADAAQRTTCLNCDTELTGEFCANCGQRASTRRFSLASLLDQSFYDETFQLNRGLGRTLLQLLYRPGHIAVEYISGHRKRYFNFVSLLLLLIATDIVLRSFAEYDLYHYLEEQFRNARRRGLDVQPAELSQLMREYYQPLLLASVPVFSLLFWGIFRRMRLTYLESVVAVFYLYAAQTLLGLFSTLTAIASGSQQVGALAYEFIGYLAGLLTFVFSWQFATGYYGVWGRLWRGILVMTIFILIVNLFFFWATLFFSDHYAG